MRSPLRYTLLLASALIACGGISGCSSEPETNSGKMGGAMDKMDTGKTGGAMDKMEKGKMGGAMDKMEKGKME
jgi:hypothetical protein